MQLDLNDLLEIIDDQRRRLIVAATAAALEEGTEDAKNAAAEFVKIINHYTSEMARVIEKVESERVEGMLKDMEAEQ